MALRNGDLRYFSGSRAKLLRENRSFWRRVWLAGGLSVVTTMISAVVVSLLASAYRAPLMDIPLVWYAWVFTFPGALLSGLCARTGEESARVALAAGGGAALLPLLVAGFPIALFLGCASLVSALVVSHAIYLARCACGYQPPRAGAPYSSLSCVECGYWLPGLSQRRCPECGEPFGRQM